MPEPAQPKKSPLAWIIIVVVLIAAGVYWTTTGRIDRELIGQNIVIKRIVQASGKTDSAYVALPYNRDSEEYSYLNVAVDFNQDGRFAAYQATGQTQAEWVVRNIQPRVLSQEGNSLSFTLSDVEVENRQDFSTVVMLTKKQMTSWAGEAIRGSAFRSSSLAAIASEDVSLLYSANPETEGGVTKDSSGGAVNAQGEIPNRPPLDDAADTSEGTEATINLGNSQPSPATGTANKTKTIETLGKEFDVFHGDVPDISQGRNECVPTSTANSLLWLAQEHKFTDKMPGSDAQLISELKTDLKWGEAGVDTKKDYLTGKKVFTDRRGLPIETHAVSAAEYDLNIVAKIAQELKRGQDVEVSFAYYKKKADGTWEKTGGHMVTAVGARGTKDGQSLEIHDPLSPGPSKLDLYKIDGTRVVDYRYQGNTVTYIRTAYAESPILTPTATNTNSSAPPVTNSTNTALPVNASGATPIFTGSYEADTLTDGTYYFNVMVTPIDLAGQTVNGMEIDVSSLPVQPYYFDVNVNQAGWASQGDSDWSGKMADSKVVFSGSTFMRPSYKTIGTMFFARALAFNVALQVTLLNNGLPVAAIEIKP